jgi:hypothetical protein
VTRFHSEAQARFYLEHLGADFTDYRREHAAYAEARKTVHAALEAHGRFQAIDRGFLPNYVFGPDDVVVALGQDGLVANTLKYLNGHPLIGINPEPARFDGVLLPFDPADLKPVLADTLADRRDHKAVTMAEARLADGQRLLAVNDLFIGPEGHTSARYEIALGKKREVQSSSGLIVATGLGSTAWIKSVVTGALAVAASFGANLKSSAYKPSPWDADHLQFAVREPFPSRASQATLIYGRVDAAHPLELHSLMPEHGVIFSDGILTDFLAFNSGSVAKIGVAKEVGRVVV